MNSRKIAASEFKENSSVKFKENIAPSKFKENSSVQNKESSFVGFQKKSFLFESWSKCSVWKSSSRTFLQ